MLTLDSLQYFIIAFNVGLDSFHTSVCLCHSVFLSIFPYPSFSVCLPAYLHIRLSVCVYMGLYLCQSVCLCVCLIDCLSGSSCLVESCREALGMQTGEIPDEAISVSSSSDSLNLGPSSAR